jgi:hypothetical protein
MFEDGKDLFNRKAGEGSMLDMMKSIRLEVNLNGDAFMGGKLRMTGISTEQPLEKKSIVLNLKKDDMEYIKKTVPFSPAIGIWFKAGEVLSIPRGLGTTSLTFNAEIDYRVGS